MMSTLVAGGAARLGHVSPAREAYMAYAETC